MTRWTSIVLTLALAILTGCAANSPATVRVLTYNIHHGEGEDGRIDLERIAQVIRDAHPDLVALQEVDRGVKRTAGVDQPAELASLTGLHVVFERNIDIQGGEYGNAVLSRTPIEFHENHALPRMGNNEQRGVLEVHVRIDGMQLVFFATHFDHQHDDGERLASAAMLQTLVAQHEQVPIIVAGDLNAVPDSRTLGALGEFLTNPCPVQSADDFTYSAAKPTERIDYVLYNQPPHWRCDTCRVIPEAVASDHRPLLTVFELNSAD